MVLPSGLIATLFTLCACPSNFDFSCPETMSHTLGRVGGSGFRIRIFKMTDVKQLPGSFQATHRTVLSHEPETMVVPSGLIATLVTALVCPSSLDFSCPETMSHTLGRVGGSGFRIQIFK